MALFCVKLGNVPRQHEINQLASPAALHAAAQTRMHALRASYIVQIPYQPDLSIGSMVLIVGNETYWGTIIGLEHIINPPLTITRLECRGGPTCPPM